MALPQDWSEFFPNEPPPLIPRPTCLYLIFLVPAPNPHNWPPPLALQRAWCDKFAPHGTHSAPCQFTIKHISVCHGPWPNVNSQCMLVPRLVPTPRGNTRSLFSSRSSFKIKSTAGLATWPIWTGCHIYDISHQTKALLIHEQISLVFTTTLLSICRLWSCKAPSKLINLALSFIN